MLHMPLLLQVGVSDFYVRYHTVQLLTALLNHCPTKLQVRQGGEGLQIPAQTKPNPGWWLRGPGQRDGGQRGRLCVKEHKEGSMQDGVDYVCMCVAGHRECVCACNQTKRKPAQTMWVCVCLESEGRQGGACGREPGPG